MRLAPCADSPGDNGVIGSRDGYRYPSRDRRGLENRVGRGSSPASRESCATSGLAEDLAQDALVAALEQWPESGVPREPGRLAHGRGEASRDRSLPPQQAARTQARGARLRARVRAGGGRARISTPRWTTTSATTCCGWCSRPAIRCCRPRRASRSRCGLLGGLTTDEIARAFLVSEPTIAQRIVRAKRTLAEKRVPFEVPRGAELAAARCRRCSRSSISSSTRATRRPPATTGCGRRCARTRCGSGAFWPSSLPEEPEVHGLVALMEIQASRSQSARRPVGRADPAARSEPRAVGSAADPPRARRARARRDSWAARAVRTRCRRRSPPVTPGP